MSDAPTIDGEIESPEADPYSGGLWARARYWAWEALDLFGQPKDIAAVGLSRRMGLRCCNWLWSIEGIVRRLVIAAALLLDPASFLAQGKRKPAAAPRSAPPAKAKRKALPVFRVYAVRNASAQTLQAVSAAEASAGERAPTQLHRRLAFPADGLLQLGPGPGKGAGPRKAARHYHPLARRGRRSRWDPDYSYEEAEARAERDRLGNSYRSSSPRKRTPKAERDPWFRHGFASVIPEWRRIEDEWARIIPAPDLGARLFALWRVVEKPQGWITRTARRLYANRPVARRITDEPPPVLKKPKRDRLPVPPALDLLAEVCSVMPCFDSS
jgi:hypothetical protein